ncbi:hypothetical protein KTT_50630 [Tengunoibacter tsumagoiensis]|uniref:Chaplin domain-containing protein n=1 Tax=Tengunoibacter tsumagoiensis TaxID=2014871 RepID=A0A402A7R2_9CHLR|nr:hypothetical protein KTT_50630 [Tengunoibacter tsumagoiensis]
MRNILCCTLLVFSLLALHFLAFPFTHVYASSVCASGLKEVDSAAINDAETGRRMGTLTLCEAAGKDGAVSVEGVVRANHTDTEIGLTITEKRATVDNETCVDCKVLSGNLLQAPVHVPINVCGNTVNVIALLNPAFGNTCINK